MVRATRTLASIALAVLLAGCSSVGFTPAAPSDTRDGKCHGPDYNAPNCVYLF